MIKIIGLLSFFYVSNIYAMQYDFVLNNTKISRSPRACISCRANKLKCDGLKECNNCLNNNKICVYQEPKKRGRKAKYQPDNQELHDSIMLPSFSVVNQYVDTPYEEGSFYIGDNNESKTHDDLNKKSKRPEKPKKPAKKAMANIINRFISIL